MYGFISFPYDILYDIINHPYFQRLRRIGQMGLSHQVYPGALHTRFHHALGSLHLTTQAIKILREKDVTISEEEAKGVSIAILLHDIGHGPFSHALENVFIKASHEEISLAFMEELNIEFEGELNLAIEIFKNKYPRKFLHQMVSSQLDMDRLDYLNRDSFFTGVAEGVVSYDRIIKMLNVRNDELLVEEKGIFSIEKFLMSRRLMYWQVYLHKTSIIAEQMLVQFIKLFREYIQKEKFDFYSDDLAFFFHNLVTGEELKSNRNDIISKYAMLDDIDVYTLLKKFLKKDHFSLNFISKGLIHRNLFKIEIFDEEIKCDYVNLIRLNLGNGLKLNTNQAKELVLTGSESNQAYNTLKDEIKILYKNGKVLPLSSGINYMVQTQNIVKYFICYPKYTVSL